MSAILHAGLLALRRGGRWRGVLIQGASGTGKSDLALRALEIGFRLVADDRTLVWSVEGDLFGRAPAPLSGLLEVRGLDVVPCPALDFCRIDLVVTAGTPERLPAPESVGLAGASAPVIRLVLTDASAPHRIREALWRLGAGPEEAYQGDLPAPAAPAMGESAP